MKVQVRVRLKIMVRLQELMTRLTSCLHAFVCEAIIIMVCVENSADISCSTSQ